MFLFWNSNQVDILDYYLPDLATLPETPILSVSDCTGLFRPFGLIILWGLHFRVLFLGLWFLGLSVPSLPYFSGRTPTTIKSSSLSVLCLPLKNLMQIEENKSLCWQAFFFFFFLSFMTMNIKQILSTAQQFYYISFFKLFFIGI